MNRRVSLAKETKFYLGNGLELPNSELPSLVTTRYFWTRIMDKLFFARNAQQGHVCTAACGRVIRLQLGSKGKKNIKQGSTEDLLDLIKGFEEMIGLYAGSFHGELEIKGLGLLFTPCARKLEILESAVYLTRNT